MKRWLWRAAQLAAGAFLGSLLLENLTRLAVWWFVPRVHDVGFALIITLVSTFGAFWGTAGAASFLFVQAGRVKAAGGLALVSGGLGLALSSSPVLWVAKEKASNPQEFADTLAYFGFALAASVVLLIWGLSCCLRP